MNEPELQKVTFRFTDGTILVDFPDEGRIEMKYPDESIEKYVAGEEDFDPLPTDRAKEYLGVFFDYIAGPDDDEEDEEGED